MNFVKGQTIANRTILDVAIVGSYVSTDKRRFMLTLDCDQCQKPYQSLATTLSSRVAKNKTALWACDSCKRANKVIADRDRRTATRQAANLPPLKTQTPIKTETRTTRAGQVTFFTVQCEDCPVVFEGQLRGIRLMEGRGDCKIRCAVCRKKRKRLRDKINKVTKSTEPNREPIWKRNVRATLASLTEDERRQVVGRFNQWQASNKSLKVRVTGRDVQDFMHDMLQLLSVERKATDVARLVDMQPQKTEPFRSYPAYESPKSPLI